MENSKNESILYLNGKISFQIKNKKQKEDENDLQNINKKKPGKHAGNGRLIMIEEFF